MKKSLYILFLSVYLLSIVGINISAHFCGDELVSVNIVTADFKSEPDGCCDEPCSDSCCHNKITTIKMEDSQKAEAIKKLDNLFASDIPQIPIDNEIPYSELVIKPLFLSHSPPGDYTYILNCTYLI